MLRESYDDKSIRKTTTSHRRIPSTKQEQKRGGVLAASSHSRISGAQSRVTHTHINEMDIDNTYSIVAEEEDVTTGIDETVSEMVDADGMTLDTEKVVVTVALFVITFVILSPRGSLRHAWRIWCARRMKNHCPGEEAKEQVTVVTGHSPKSTVEDVSNLLSNNGQPSPKSTTTLCTGMVLPPPPLEELTEEARFADLWPTIRTSNYRRVVLPPACKLVDKPKKKSMIKKQQDEQQPKVVPKSNRPIQRTIPHGDLLYIVNTFCPC